MAEKYSDIIIAGTDLAGLIAGAFLAKRGLGVTVLNFDKDVSAEKKTIQPNLVTHLESRLFKSILGRLSILDHELNITEKFDVPYQVILPNHRIDVYRQREKLYNELKREFPQDFEVIKKFYEAMDHFEATLDETKLQDLILPDGIKKRWKFEKFVQANGLNDRISDYLDQLGYNEEVKTFLESQLKLLSKTHSENPFTYQIAKTLGNDNGVLYEIEGGVEHLKKIFLDKIESFSGRIQHGNNIEHLLLENRRVKGIQLDSFEGFIGARYLLWNEEIKGITKFLPRNFWTRSLLNKIAMIKPGYYHFSIQFKIDPHVIPMGMKENALYIQDPASELTGANYLHLHLLRPHHRSDSEPAFLTVSYLLEAEKINSPTDYFVNLHEEITHHIAKLMPFSNHKIELSFPLVLREIEPDGTLFPMEKNDFEIFRENAQLNPIYEVTPNRFGDLFPLHHRTPYKNLFFTSPELLASLGLEGKFLLGLKIIDVIWGEAESSQKKAIRQRKIA